MRELLAVGVLVANIVIWGHVFTLLAGMFP